MPWKKWFLCSLILAQNCGYDERSRHHTSVLTQNSSPPSNSNLRDAQIAVASTAISLVISLFALGGLKWSYDETDHLKKLALSEGKSRALDIIKQPAQLSISKTVNGPALNIETDDQKTVISIQKSELRGRPSYLITLKPESLLNTSDKDKKSRPVLFYSIPERVFDSIMSLKPVEEDFQSFQASQHSAPTHTLHLSARPNATLTSSTIELRVTPQNAPSVSTFAMRFDHGEIKSLEKALSAPCIQEQRCEGVLSTLTFALPSDWNAIASQQIRMREQAYLPKMSSVSKVQMISKLVLFSSGSVILTGIGYLFAPAFGRPLTPK